MVIDRVREIGHGMEGFGDSAEVTGTGGVSVVTDTRRHKSSVRLFLWCLAAVAVLTASVGALHPAPVLADWAPPQTVYVPRTGHTSDGLFLQAWRNQRSLLGDPVTEEFTTQTGLGLDPDAEQIVQYYENLALVYLPDEAPENQVRTLDLGQASLAAALENQPSAALTRAARRTSCPTSGGDCLAFSETGHTVDNGFRVAWEEADGELWLGLPISEAYRAPNGTWIQYFERGALQAPTTGVVKPLPLGRMSAQRLELDTTRIVRPFNAPLFASSLFVTPPVPEAADDVVPVEGVAPLEDAALVEEAAPLVDAAPVAEPEPIVEEVVPVVEEVPVYNGPGAQQGAYQEVVISISAQMLWAYEGGELVNSTYVSTGTAEVPETTTPIGSHSILTKVDMQDMEGTISGEDYFVADVPYVMYFDNLGNALHGTYWHSNFGAPMSHGCINLPMDVAAWMYEWAPVGTAVTVIG